MSWITIFVAGTRLGSTPPPRLVTNRIIILYTFLVGANKWISKTLNLHECLEPASWGFAYLERIANSLNAGYCHGTWWHQPLFIYTKSFTKFNDAKSNWKTISLRLKSLPKSCESMTLRMIALKLSVFCILNIRQFQRSPSAFISSCSSLLLVSTGVEVNKDPKGVLASLQGWTWRLETYDKTTKIGENVRAIFHP